MPGLLAGTLVAGLVLLWAWLLWRQDERLVAVGLVGLATCLASPLAWTHHYVWAVVVLVGVVTSRRLAGWIRLGLTIWMGWVALCPPLVFLPYGAGIEAHYDPGQLLIANAGPLSGSLLVLAGLVTSFGQRMLPRKSE
jgi:alpha-1,2-mannosyltransferase